MEPNTKRLIGTVAALVIAAFAFGYWLAPEKVKVETKVVTVEKKVIEYVKDKTSHKKTVIVRNPDGSSTTTITDDTETKTDKNVSDNKNTSSDTLKEVTKSSSRLSIAALVGSQVSLSSPPTFVYGLHVSRELIGPISIGIFGLSNGIAGGSVGVSF